METKTQKSIIFETLSDDIAERYYDTIDALRDLEKQYKHFTTTVWKASKQLLKYFMSRCILPTAADSGQVSRYSR